MKHLKWYDKLKWWQKIFCFPLLIDIMLVNSLKKSPVQKEREREKEKEIMRNFKINVKTGFLGNKIEYIQRDKPLTNEELEVVLKSK